MQTHAFFTNQSSVRTGQRVLFTHSAYSRCPVAGEIIVESGEVYLLQRALTYGTTPRERKGYPHSIHLGSVNGVVITGADGTHPSGIFGLRFAVPDGVSGLPAWPIPPAGRP